MPKKIDRRKFLKTTALVGTATAMLPRSVVGELVSDQHVRLGFIGTGLRGQWMLQLAAQRSDVDIAAICDIDDHMISLALDVIKRQGNPPPDVYLSLIHI